MPKPMSKSQIVAHLSESTGASKKTVQSLLDELVNLAAREVRGDAGKFTIPNFAHASRKIGSPGQALIGTQIVWQTHKAFGDAVSGSWLGPREPASKIETLGGKWHGPRKPPGSGSLGSK
jgi:hypothetical protein